mgnify:CR=1 FL=1
MPGPDDPEHKPITDGGSPAAEHGHTRRTRGTPGRGNKTTRDLPPSSRSRATESRAPALDVGAPGPAAQGDDPFGMHLLGAGRDSDDENAYMTARAYAADGTLLDMWIGPAFFHGSMPATYSARRQRGRWRWTRDGAPVSDGERLKIDSDADGKKGVPLGAWAPDDAHEISVHFHGLVSPFAGGEIQVDDRSPLDLPGEMARKTADGAEPFDPSLTGRLVGPLGLNETATVGDLEVTQRADATFFRVGSSTLHVIHDGDERCVWEVEQVTSGDQRVIQLHTTPGVQVNLANHPGSPQIVVHRDTQPHAGVLPSRDPAMPALANPGTITAVGDPYRVWLQLDNSNIHIQCLSPETRFAYYVAPEWVGDDGTERPVHIVATPGVKVDEWRVMERGGAAPTGGNRRLVPNTIYVQNPDDVPKQGTPIDPAQFLHQERRGYGKDESGRRLGTVISTGNQGITVRDTKYGATITIAATDRRSARASRGSWSIPKTSSLKVARWSSVRSSVRARSSMSTRFIAAFPATTCPLPMATSASR